jgi:hypothetical protein
MVRAIAALRPGNAHTTRAILNLLGVPAEALQVEHPMEENEVTDPKVTVIGVTEPSPPEPNRPISEAARVNVAVSAELIHATAAPPQEPEAAVVLEPDPSEQRRSRARPAWLARSPSLAEPPDPSRTLSQTPVKTPLFVRSWTRGILSGSLSTLQHDGPIDVKHVVDMVSRGTPVVEVPREARATMAGGAQVLVDRSDAMVPYLEDQERLVAQIRDVVGEGNVEVLRFDGCPSWGAGRGTRRTWSDYHAHHTPQPGTAVLVLTDIGIGTPDFAGRHPATVDDWVGFAIHLRRAGCPVVAFVPYGPSRWPDRLRQVMRILHWDHRTSARTVRREIGKGLIVEQRRMA